MSRLWHTERAQGARSISLLGGQALAHASGPSLQDQLAQAYRAGADDTRHALEAQIAADRAHLAQLAATLEGLAVEPCEPLAASIVDAVHRLVQDIVGDAPVDGELLRARALSLARAIGAGDARRVIRANPADLAFLDALTVADVVADPAIARGNLRMIEGDSIAEDGVAPALQRLQSAIDDMGLAS